MLYDLSRNDLLYSNMQQLKTMDYVIQNNISVPILVFFFSIHYTVLEQMYLQSLQNINSIIFSRSLYSSSKPISFLTCSLPSFLVLFSQPLLPLIHPPHLHRCQQPAVFSIIWECCNRVQWKSEKEFFLTHGTSLLSPSISLQACISAGCSSSIEFARCFRSITDIIVIIT